MSKFDEILGIDPTYGFMGGSWKTGTNGNNGLPNTDRHHVNPTGVVDELKMFRDLLFLKDSQGRSYEHWDPTINSVRLPAPREGLSAADAMEQ